MTIGVAVLGSTGSIGRSTLQVLARQRERFRVVAITGHSNKDLLAQQAAEWKPAFVGLVNGGDKEKGNGTSCLVEAATHPDVRIVVNGIVGAAGLEATLAALRAGKRVALANKETLVMAGELVAQAARDGGGEIVKKITVDSATLVNKALEVIEAHFLFDVDYDQVEVVIHPQSVIHGFAEFVDGSVLAQVGFPTMELPILYALTYPDRVPDQGVRRFDPVAAGTLTFEALQPARFPAYVVGREAARQGGTAPARFNAANEVAVQLFLEQRIAFGRIAEIIEHVVGRGTGDGGRGSSLEEVLAADAEARRQAQEVACS